MLPKEQLAKRCLEAREEFGLSREQLIDVLSDAGFSVAHQTVFRWESGKRDVPGWYLRALTQVLVVDPTWLLWGADSPAQVKLAEVRARLLEVCDLIDDPPLSGSGEDGRPDSQDAVDAYLSQASETVGNSPEEVGQGQRRGNRRAG